MGNLIIFVWAIRLTWFFLTGDTRTWKSLLTHAYDGTTHDAKGGKKVDMDKKSQLYLKLMLLSLV